MVYSCDLPPRSTGRPTCCSQTVKFRPVVIRLSLTVLRSFPTKQRTQMERRHHLDDVTRGRIIGRIEAGQTQRMVSRDLGVAQSVISRVWNRFNTDGNVTRRHSSGRPRCTTPNEDRYLALTCRRNRRSSATVLASHLQSATGTSISRFTVYRRLRAVGLYARRPDRCLPLTASHRRERLRWAQEHRHWTREQWGRVLFTDESRFTLQSDSGRVLVWRERGTRYHRTNITEIDQYRGGGVMVWGGIMLMSRTQLHVFGRGTVNATVYRDTILQQRVRLFRGAVGPDFILMDDNARPHRALIVDDYLEEEDIHRMTWPARSPDLNPIEHVWGMVGRRIAGQLTLGIALDQLRTLVARVWESLPQDMVDHLIDGMGRRCEACIASRGDHIPY